MPGNEISRNGDPYQCIPLPDGGGGFILFGYWIYGAHSVIMERTAAFP
jgi:hypothetical protein